MDPDLVDISRYNKFRLEFFLFLRGGLPRWWQWAMTWAKTVEIDGGWWRATRWVITWAMMWAITMAGLMVDNGGVDGGRWKRGHWWCCFVWSWENLQPELLARKSRHYLILPTTFVTVSIVHIVGIVRVHIWDSKPWDNIPIFCTNIPGRPRRN